MYCKLNAQGDIVSAYASLQPFETTFIARGDERLETFLRLHGGA